MWLITGASGFLGHALLQALAQQGEAVPRVAVLLRDKHNWQPPAGLREKLSITTIEGGLDDVRRWQDEAQRLQITGIFHLAAVVLHSRDGCAQMLQTNIAGTEQIVSLGQKLGARTLFLSSSGTVACSRDSAHSVVEGAPFCEQTVAGWPYYRSKIAAEKAARAIAPQAEQLVILRPPVILGPGDHRFRSSGTVIRFLRGRLPFVLAGGIAFTDVREVASALIAAMQHPTPKPIYHLAGHAMSLADFFAQIGAVAGRRAPRVTLPEPIAMAVARLHRLLPGNAHLFPDPVVIEMGHHFWRIDSTCAAADLGYVLRPAAQTLDDTVRWLRAHRSDCGAQMPS